MPAPEHCQSENRNGLAGASASSGLDDPADEAPSSSRRGGGSAGSQSSRRRRREDTDFDEEDADVRKAVARAEGARKRAETAAALVDGDEMERIVKKLVRLALFNESRRAPLRRDEINKKVIGGHSKAYKAIFARAQQRLRETFGLEMVELPQRAPIVAALTGHTAANGETAARKAAVAAARANKTAKQGNGDATSDPPIVETGSKLYVLRSCLPQELRIAGLVTLSGGDTSTGNGDPVVPTCVTIDSTASYGFVMTILALILVNDRVIDQAHLTSYLKKLAVDSLDPSPHPKLGKIEALIEAMLREGYLDRTQLSQTAVPGGGGANNAARSVLGDLGGAGALLAKDRDRMFDYRWGPRAKVEVGEEAVVVFIRQVYGNAASDELERNIRRAAGMETEIVANEEPANADDGAVAGATGTPAGMAAANGRVTAAQPVDARRSQRR